ncbi:hypothetical protein V6N12_031472 [Hibiscus sabdariffa]|uniref:Uncharacterized protein n=1 Tax=Hibiscus sabdariffa TaxID=183260 RepID=A0ABR2CPC6_9ROSI
MEGVWLRMRHEDVSDSLVRKLREMKMVIKEWNCESFGNVNEKYQILVAEIEELDTRLNIGEMGSSELNRKREQARIRIVRNGIRGTQYNWRWETELERVKFLFAREFRRHVLRVKMNGGVDLNVAFSVLSLDQRVGLEQEFSEAEVKATI